MLITQQTKPTVQTSGGGLDLDDLLLSSLKNKEKKEKKTTTAKPAKPPTSKESNEWMNASDRDSLKADIKRRETLREWEPVAVVAMFTTQICICCGSSHSQFTGVFQQQVQRNVGIMEASQVNRWVRDVNYPKADKLPKLQKVSEEAVDMCISCAGSLGYQKTI